MAVAVTAVVCFAVGMVGVGLLAATLPALKWLARAGKMPQEGAGRLVG